MIQIDPTKCNKDYLCIAECAYGFMFEKDQDGYPHINEALSEKYCIHCWHCVAVCPKGAVSAPGIDPNNLEKTSRKDIPSHDQLEKFIRARRSFRTFKNEPVSDEIILKWLDITRWSPTATNSQQLNWILIKDTEKIQDLAGLIIEFLKQGRDYQEIIEQWGRGRDITLRHAPHLLIVTLPEEYFWSMTDAATAISYLELTAASLGLGTCWAGYLTRAATAYPPLREKLNLPENHKVAGALMFGHPSHRFTKIPNRNKLSIQYL